MLGPGFDRTFAPERLHCPVDGNRAAEAGYLVDSSVNPSWLVKSKAGGSTWNSVVDAMEKAGVVERSWLTRRTLPVNGPALFKFPLSLNAKPAGGGPRPPLSRPTD